MAKLGLLSCDDCDINFNEYNELNSFGLEHFDLPSFDDCDIHSNKYQLPMKIMTWKET